MRRLIDRTHRWRWLVRIQFFVMLATYLYLGATRISAEVAASFNDLVAHALGYTVAAVSAYVAFTWGRSFFLSLVFLWAFSLFVEIVQFHLPYRSFSIADILANTSGLVVGTFVVFVWRMIAHRIGARIGSMNSI